ncbi:TPA: hypothetical protein NV469_002078 [Escherichia coli]|nr:hypothetical protein [Escherichia coli]
MLRLIPFRQQLPDAMLSADLPGTVGSNRDEFVVVRKMKNIDWLDGEGNDQVQESVK